MSNVEHLIENALTATTKAKDIGEDTSEAFTAEMNAPHNKEMLERVSMTEMELWEIVQYLLYDWFPNMQED